MSSTEDPESQGNGNVSKPLETSKSGGGGMSTWMVAILACVFGVAVASIPLGVRYNDCKANESKYVDHSKNTCWKPLYEMDGHGFLFAQQHVGGYLQKADDSYLVMTDMPDMSLAPGGDYDYGWEVDNVLKNLQRVTTMKDRKEISFFDGKLNIASSIIGTMIMIYGFSVEQFILHVHGETTALLDAGIAVWKNKLINSRIRPTSVIQQNFPDETFQVNNGLSVKGRNFEATVRVMPHSEYPSGSSCVCLALKEFVDETWPRMDLHGTNGTSIEYNKDTAIILPNPFLDEAPIFGGLQPSKIVYNSDKMNERCGETREEGGIHFTPAVPAGRKLCEGMGTTVGKKVLSLVPGSDEKSVRELLGTTPPCADDCCAEVEMCDETQKMECKAKCMGMWDFPWFDKIDAIKTGFSQKERATAVNDPFFNNLDRHLLTIMLVQGSTIPLITKAETIYHFRYTSILDNILWDSVVYNSADFKTIKFGRSKEPMDPTVRSGQTSSDARILTAVHATAAVIPSLLPGSEVHFKMTVVYEAVMPMLGFDPILIGLCGDPVKVNTEYKEECLTKYYEMNGMGPSQLGQIIAYEILFHRTRDGFNSEGTDDGCDAGRHFCPRYNDVTNYDPEVGPCLNENLMDTLSNFDAKTASMK